MKHITLLFVLLSVTLTACPIIMPVNKYSIARKKEKLNCNIELINKSSSAIQFKYAPVPYREEIEKNIPFYSDYCTSVTNQLVELGYRGGFSKYYIGVPYFLNVYGSLVADGSAVLYTGVDGGTYIEHPSNKYPNVNVDGLPARFVLMIDGDTTCYSLVYDCPSSSGTHELILTDEIINRLKAIKEGDFVIGYNGRREWYGPSVKIQERLYCFEQVDIKKSSLIDYTKSDCEFKTFPNYLQREGMYGKIYFQTGNVEAESSDLVLVYYNNNEQKFYYVTEEDNPSVNPIE